MNWNKIMNIFIAIFLCINIGIFSISQYRDVQLYTLSDERLSQLGDILNENGFALYSLVPKYFPMKKIILETPILNKENIVRTIFDGEEFTTTFTNEYERYVSEQQELTFLKGNQKGKITYNGSNSQYIPSAFTEKEVIKVGKKFAEAITLSIPKLTLTRKDRFKDYYLLEFNETYKGQILFCSYVSLKISAKGVEEASALRYAPVEFTDAEEKLYPIDEVLYSFMRIVQPNEGELYSINRIDLGYDLGMGDLEENYSAQAVPYYRIKLNISEAYYFINAYTNELKQTE